MNTRKYPRTLNEAFGPYTSTEFADDRADYGAAWLAAMALVVVLAFIVVVA